MEISCKYTMIVHVFYTTNKHKQAHTIAPTHTHTLDILIVGQLASHFLHIL